MSDSKKEFTILITDDEKINIDVLGGILSPAYNLLIARDGQRALELATEHKPDLILLDVLMPGISGFDVIARLKENEATSKIPVIFITALANARDEEKGFSLGAADYIGKPFSAPIVKMRVLNQINLIAQIRLIVAKETEEKSSCARREFLSRMSHEMRTPMNAIIGMTNLAQTEDDILLIKDHLKTIENSSQDLMDLIDGILDMAAIEDGKFKLVSSGFNIRSSIREVLNRSVENRKQKKQTLSVDIDSKVPQTVTGDEKRLSQVINHLVSNAIKFTGENGLIQVKLSMADSEADTAESPGSDDSGILQFEIVDNGIGMNNEQQKKIFMFFEQADGSLNRNFGGAGAGLFLARHIVEMSGGRIHVESEPGKGSKFIFTVRIRGLTA